MVRVHEYNEVIFKNQGKNYMKFFEAILRNKNTGLEQDYLLKAENDGDIVDYLIGEGNSYCGEGNFTYNFDQTSKNNRKFKDV
jgi:hypothetical protein